MSGQSAMDASRVGEELGACSSMEGVLSNGIAATFVRSSATVIAGAQPAAVFFLCPEGARGVAGDTGGVPWATTRVVCAKLRSVLRACARGLFRHGIRLEVVGIERRCRNSYASGISLSCLLAEPLSA